MNGKCDGGMEQLLRKTNRSGVGSGDTTLPLRRPCRHLTRNICGPVEAVFALLDKYSPSEEMKNANGTMADYHLRHSADVNSCRKYAGRANSVTGNGNRCTINGGGAGHISLRTGLFNWTLRTSGWFVWHVIVGKLGETWFKYFGPLKNCTGVSDVEWCSGAFEPKFRHSGRDLAGKANFFINFDISTFVNLMAKSHFIITDRRHAEKLLLWETGFGGRKERKAGGGGAGT